MDVRQKKDSLDAGLFSQSSCRDGEKREYADEDRDEGERVHRRLRSLLTDSGNRGEVAVT